MVRWQPKRRFDALSPSRFGWAGDVTAAQHDHAGGMGRQMIGHLPKTLMRLRQKSASNQSSAV